VTPHAEQTAWLPAVVQTVISNGVLELTLEQNAGSAAFKSLRDVATGTVTQFSADMVWRAWSTDVPL
jgi:hypothetical protein